MLWGGKGDASSALEWTHLNEKIQKNLIKVSLMRQPIFSALWCINHTFLFYDQIFFLIKFKHLFLSQLHEEFYSVQ